MRFKVNNFFRKLLIRQLSKYYKSQRKTNQSVSRRMSTKAVCGPNLKNFSAKNQKKMRTKSL